MQSRSSEGIQEEILAAGLRRFAGTLQDIKGSYADVLRAVEERDMNLPDALDNLASVEKELQLLHRHTRALREGVNAIAL